MRFVNDTELGLSAKKTILASLLQIQNQAEAILSIVLILFVSS